MSELMDAGTTYYNNAIGLEICLHIYICKGNKVLLVKSDIETLLAFAWALIISIRKRGIHPDIEPIAPAPVT